MGKQLEEHDVTGRYIRLRGDLDPVLIFLMGVMGILLGIQMMLWASGAC